eukprot:3299790-Prymnesium_polylepis.3
MLAGCNAHKVKEDARWGLRRVEPVLVSMPEDVVRRDEPRRREQHMFGLRGRAWPRLELLPLVFGRRGVPRRTRRERRWCGDTHVRFIPALPTERTQVHAVLLRPCRVRIVGQIDRVPCQSRQQHLVEEILVPKESYRKLLTLARVPWRRQLERGGHPRLKFHEQTVDWPGNRRIAHVDDPDIDVGEAALGVECGHEVILAKRAVEVGIRVDHCDHVRVQRQHGHAKLEQAADVVKLLDPRHVLAFQLPTAARRT